MRECIANADYIAKALFLKLKATIMLAVFGLEILGLTHAPIDLIHTRESQGQDKTLHTASKEVRYASRNVSEDESKWLRADAPT